MHLVKLYVSKDAAISKSEFRSRIDKVYGDDYPLNGHRTPTDAARVALAYGMRKWQAFEHNGLACRAMASTPKNVPRGIMHIDIHVQERDSKGVNYTSKVATIKYTEEDCTTLERGESYDKYEFMVDELDIPLLVYVGQHTYFESDLRRIFAQLTDGQILKFWAGGLYVCLTDDQFSVVQNAASVFNQLSTGRLAVKEVTLDDTESNKASVAESLGEDVFSPAFDALTERANKAGPNIERLESEYADLIEQIAQAESWLGQSIPCAESQEAFEVALSALYESA